MAQAANDVEHKSVGEKASPFPLLSVGASVIIFVPLCKCVHSKRKSPKYFAFTVAISFFLLCFIFQR